MATPSYIESLVSSAKRLRVSPPKPALRRNAHQLRPSPNQPAASEPQRRNASQITTPDSQNTSELRGIRLPKAIAATYLTPLKRTPTHSLPVADLQIRSYSVRNLELYADFCLRAAYYLNLPARGPVPLPKITERWTVPRANFVFKKSQENFERITCRRLIQIQDGHPETVALWLAYVQKHRYYGIGMKANVFEHGGLDVVKDLEAEGKNIDSRLHQMSELFGAKKGAVDSAEQWDDLLHREPFKASWGAAAPLGGAHSVQNMRLAFDLDIMGGEKPQLSGEGLEKVSKASTESSKSESTGEAEQ